MKRYGLVLAALLIIALAFVAPAAAVDIPVDNSSATAIQDNVTRAASGDTLVLAPGTYFEKDITITGKSLTFRADTANGHGPLDTILDANRAGRIFYVSDGSSLTIDNITLRNGRTANGANGGAGENGGAIASAGPVTITSSTITDCSTGNGGSFMSGIYYHTGGSGGSGGAISGSTITVTSSTITGCSAGSGGTGAALGNGGSGGSGGAIFGSTVTVTSSTITGCSAGSGGTGGIGSTRSGGTGGVGGSGGAISGSTVTVTSSTITGCSAGVGGTGGGSGTGRWGGDGGAGGSGGAIFGTTVTVTSSTITGCPAGRGGGGGQGALFSGGDGANGGWGGNGGSAGAIFGTTVTVTSSTITGCSAGSGGNGGSGGAGGGGGFFNGRDGAGGTVGTVGAIYAGSGGTIRFCRLVDNDVGTPVVGSLDAENNWWGTNSNPSVYVSGADADPWLVLTTPATPPSVTTSRTSVIRASLTTNSDGTDTSISGQVPDGIPVTFAVTGTGSVAPGSATTTSGAATATYTPGSAGTAMIRTTVDGDVALTPITVTSGGSGAATSIVIDPAAPATLYAGLDGSGIYRSSNGGGLWLPATTQPGNLNIRALAINPTLSSRLYAGTYGGGVYTSTDSGDHWTACTNTNLGNLNVLSLVSNSTGGLYAGTENGVYTSTDCNTWTAINGGLP